MQARNQWQDYLQAGKQAVQQGSTAARQIAGKVAVEALRRAKIAQPMIASFCRKASSNLRHQVRLAMPVLQRFIRQAATLSNAASQQAFTLAKAVRMQPQRTLAIGIVISLCTMTAFALTLNRKSAPASAVAESTIPETAIEEAAQDTELTPPEEQSIQPAVEPRRRAPVSLQNMVRASESPATEATPAQPSRHDQELAQLRRQAQSELERAAGDYEFALQQWKAEEAACQSGSAPGYTPNQMGRLAAMGYRPHLQPQRQPNQALYHAARQAEQQYLLARDNYQRLMNAQ